MFSKTRIVITVSLLIVCMLMPMFEFKKLSFGNVDEDDLPQVLEFTDVPKDMLSLIYSELDDFYNTSNGSYKFIRATMKSLYAINSNEILMGKVYEINLENKRYPGIHSFTVNTSPSSSRLYVTKHSQNIMASTPLHHVTNTHQQKNRGVEEVDKVMIDNNEKFFRCLSYNIYNFNDNWHERIRLIANSIKTHKPNVISFQEVRLDENQVGGVKSHQMDELRTHLLPLGYKYYVYQSAMSYVGGEGPLRFEEGLAIFSLYPIIESDYLLLYRDDRDPASHQRICLHAQILLPKTAISAKTYPSVIEADTTVSSSSSSSSSTTANMVGEASTEGVNNMSATLEKENTVLIDIYNTHLELNLDSSKKNVDDIMKKMVFSAKAIADSKGIRRRYLFLMGDFNAEETTETVKQITQSTNYPSKFMDAYLVYFGELLLEKKMEHYYTFSTNLQYRKRIDFVFYTSIGLDGTSDMMDDSEDNNVAISGKVKKNLSIMVTEYRLIGNDATLIGGNYLYPSDHAGVLVDFVVVIP